MKIAVVDDDEKLCRDWLTYLSELLGDAADCTCYPNGEALLSVWEKGCYDLVILDIFMGGLTGIDVAREIRKTDSAVKIAFGTTSNEFAGESYEVNACYYLHKPLDRDRIKAMLDRLDLAEVEKNRTVKLPDGKSVVLRDIIFVDCAAHCVTLHGKTSETVLRSPFSEIEALLCEYPYFFSPTKGVVVNFYEVVSRDGDTFRMTDGSLVPISRRKSKDVVEAYSSFLFEKIRKEGE